MVFSFLLDVLINALGFLPSIFVSTANGLLFGIVPGIIVSWLAETVGVIISFILMRTILRSSAEKLIAKSKYLQKADDFSGRNGFKIMLILRAMPYFPSGILTAQLSSEMRVDKTSFRDSTKLTYVLKEKTRVKISLVSASGQPVCMWDKGVQDSGTYCLDIKGENLHKGVYLLSLMTERGRQTLKLIKK